MFSSSIVFSINKCLNTKQMIKSQPEIWPHASKITQLIGTCITEFVIAIFRWTHSLFHKIHSRKQNQNVSVMKKEKKKHWCMK